MARRLGALLGFGAVAEKAHLPAFATSPDFELCAVAEADGARRAAAKAALPDARIYETPEALLREEKDLDFVDVATPPFLHAGLVLAALEAKLHVLCEKPLALSIEDYARVKAASRAAERCVFTVHNWACSPQWRAVFARLPLIGEVRHAALFVSRTQPARSALPGDWRQDAALAGGGVLVDHGWHNFYLLHRILPGNPKRLSAKLSPAEGAETTAKITLEYAQATADLWLTWAGAARSNTAVIHGEKGSIELRDGELVFEGPRGAETVEFERKLSAGSAHPDWMAALLPEFAAELADAGVRGRNLEEAGFCLQTIQRAYQSARVGRSAVRESFQKLSGQAQFR